LALAAAGIGTATVTACEAPGDRSPNRATQRSAPTRPVVTSAARPATDAARATGVLLAFFSRAGEQYWNGGRRTVAVGNTAWVAEHVDRLIRPAVHRIESANPYPSAYEPTVSRNWEEIQADARPALANEVPDLSRYRTVLLGSPVWAMQEPMIMRTFLDAASHRGLAGATVHPFVTYAVSELGNVMDDYRRLYPEVTFASPLAVRGEAAEHSEAQVRHWLTKLELL
jgi:flavodoxin